MSELRSSLFII